MVLATFLPACHTDPVNPPDKMVFWNTGGDQGVIQLAIIRYGQVPELKDANAFLLAIPGFAIDRTNRKIYFLTRADSLIRETNFEFKNPTVAGKITGESGGFGVGSPFGSVGRLFLSSGRLYLSQNDAAVGSRIISFNADGSDKKTLYHAQANSDTLCNAGLIRPEGSPYLYWGNATKLWRGNADGNGSPKVLYDLGTSADKGMLNDLTVWKDKIYLATTKGLWVGSTEGTGGLSRLFATETKTATEVVSLSLDTATEQLYWLCQIPQGSPDLIQERASGFLYRGNPDGTDSKLLLEQSNTSGIQLNGVQLSVF